MFKCLKDFEDIKSTAYIVTDKAVYYYKDGKFKDLIRISYEEIITVEKSDYYYDGFYIASENKTIKVINTCEIELFNLLVEKVKKS